jgi:hypothetical protein
MQTLTTIRKMQHDLAEVERFTKGAPMPSFEQMLKRAQMLLKSGDLGGAEAITDRLMAAIKAKPSAADDDEYDESDGSNPSMDAQDDEDDEEDDQDSVGKRLTKDSVNAFVRTHDDNNRPGTLSSSKHPSSSNSRHKFLALVADIKNSHGVPASQAMALARQYHPGVFDDYQKHAPTTNISKSAPMDFETAVEVEMRKGVTREVAGQRVMQMYGNLLPRTNIQKAEVAGAALEDIADQAWQSDAGLSRTEALRKARLENPTLFRRMQRT